MRPRLLIIEDDEDSLEMLGMLLDTSGFEVVSAARTALARTELARGAFDLVLADFMVGTADPTVSWRVVDDLVRLARPAPVALLTAWPIADADREVHDVAFVLEKPCRGDALCDRLSHALELPPLAPAQEDALRAYFRHLERGDFDALVAGCTEDVVYHLPSPDPRFGHTVTGSRALRDFSAQTFAQFREPRFAIDDIRPLPAGALVRYMGSWDLPSGDRAALPGSVLFVLDGTQIAQIGVRLDAAGAPRA